jgi:hypothetical protein
MSITIINEPTGIYPAYNDSFITFTSSLSGATYSVINLEPSNIFTKPFLIYPNTNGRFIFNLKDAVKFRFNEYGFEDNLTPPVTSFGQTLTNNFLSQTVSITDYNLETTGATSTRNYEFSKSVHNIGDTIIDNQYQLLLPSENGVDFHITYPEGFVNSFDIQKLNSNDVVKFKHKNTGLDSSNLISLNDDAFRVYLDKTTTNWTTSNFLSLKDSLNHLEMYINDVFKANIFIKKIPANCGVYLKWLNNKGGYSYFLFDEFYTINSDYSANSRLANNQFLNVTDGLKKTTKISGKSGGSSLQVKTLADNNEFKHLKSLFSSPSVQMYSSTEPFINGEWQNVEVDGSLNQNTKKHLNEVKLKITLADENTITY